MRRIFALLLAATLAVLGGVISAAPAHADDQYTVNDPALYQCGSDRKIKVAGFFEYQTGTGARRVVGGSAISYTNSGTAVAAIMWIRTYANWTSGSPDHYTDGTTGYSPYTSLGTDSVNGGWGARPSVFAQIQVGLSNGTACAIRVDS